MKRFLALMLSLVLVVGVLPAARADSQSNADGDAVILPDDVPSPWAYDEVHQAIVLGMVPWDLQNHWRFAITRIEFAQMVVHFLAFQHGFSSDSSFVSAYGTGTGSARPAVGGMCSAASGGPLPTWPHRRIGATAIRPMLWAS